MRFELIDVKDGDSFEEFFSADSFDEAIEKAWGYFDNLTDIEKNNRDEFYVIDDPETFVFDFLEIWNNRAKISNIACDIQNADVWDKDDCRRLCEFAGLAKEWQESDGDTSIVERAAKRLHVDICY